MEGVGGGGQKEGWKEGREGGKKGSKERQREGRGMKDRGRNNTWNAYTDDATSA